MADQNVQLDAAWEAMTQHLLAAADVIRADPRAEDPAIRAAGYRYLLNLTNAALEQKVFSADRDYPEHGRLQDSTKRYATESPDCLFGVTSLDPAGTYRVRVTGGSPHYLGFTVYRDMDHYGNSRGAASGDFAALFTAATGATLASTSSPGSLKLDDNGDCELILSAEPHEGNWLPLTPGADHVVSRQYFYDWDTEEPAHVSIERLDAAGPGPVAEVAAVLDEVVGFGQLVEGFARTWARFYNLKAERKLNILVTEPPLDASYAGDGGYISYGGGFFDLAENEAVIVEFTPPECHFWNLALGDVWSQSLDYTFRQTHLNGFQSRLDDSGVFRGVIAHRDPGVANWFDTAGNRFVHVTYRWWLAAQPDVVTPASRIVKFDDLARELDPATPLITPEERRDSLDRRRRAVLKRYRR
ncbi:MAG: hypothetical protein ACRDPS_20290 [Nocardioides sp.]|uniref:hypothetical protein n=1 Tax=Nocardioides sp. TaxID=35761 RepID=UPI003D6BEF9D